MRYLILAAVTFAVASASAGNFSQRAGFADIRASLSDQPPSAAEQTLLQTYRPVLYTAPNAAPPIDFYADYIARGVLQSNGETFTAPTAELLNAHKHNPAAQFTHNGKASGATTPVAYGGVYKTEVDWQPVGRRELTFLSYYFVFRHSGLPAGLGGGWKFLANLVADTEDWHQLDHYTAVFVVLDGDRLFAVMLQQHNAMRTYFIGGEDFPSAENIAVDAAVSSNELYPHREERAAYPAVSFLSAETVDELLQLQPGGFIAAQDITDGQKRVDYELQFLPPNDAFYVFEGWLGERRLLPGRNGPPGAIYRTLPELWALEKSLYMFYWTPQDAEYAGLVRQGEVWKNSAAMERLRERFAAKWGELLPSVR